MYKKIAKKVLQHTWWAFLRGPVHPVDPVHPVGVHGATLWEVVVCIKPP